MKFPWQPVSLGLAVALGVDALVQAREDQKSAPPPAAAAAEPERAGPTTTPTTKPNARAKREELEAKFKATLTQATMSGRWCALKDGQLTPEKEDKYTIIGVTQVKGTSWIIRTRIQYGKQDFIAPVPVEVKWAGDTPVITVDNVGMPGGNSYSARVLIHGQTYAGSWSGGSHAGLMSGIITHEAAPK